MRTQAWRFSLVLAAQSLAAVSLTSQTPPRQGSVAPAFTLATLAGSPANLSDYKGRPVLINFWASWCEPCRGEMPLIVAAYAAHKPAGLEVLAVNLTDQEGMKDVRKFVAAFQMPFPVLLDEQGRVRKLYALRGLPTTVFVGADGVVRLVNRGPVTAESLDLGLAGILPAR
jgi:thiol-disulfide isomerase/thioredoxin